MKNLTIAFMLMVSLCIHIWCDFVTFKSVHANVLFLYLLKSSENLWFSDVFRRYRNGTLVSIYEEHWSITIILKNALNSICQIGNTEPIFSQCTLSLPPSTIRKPYGFLMFSGESRKGALGARELIMKSNLRKSMLENS